MKAVDQWQEIEDGLPADWTELQLAFAPEGPAPEAAAVLLALRPGRVGDELRLHLQRDLGDAQTLRNLLRRLDEKRVWGALSLVGATAAAAELPGDEAPHTNLAEAWDRQVSLLPAGWRDLLCELELDSSALLPRAALLGAPLNPTRNPDATALRFRASSGGGYGTADEMVRRCLERMDDEGVTGRVRVLNSLSDTRNVATQGPVWRIAGKSV